MMEPQPSAAQQYYLGIEGEQSGPFTETQVIEQIQSAQVPVDALIWWEGLSDWQPIGDVEPFRDYLKPNAAENRVEPSSTPGSTEDYSSEDPDEVSRELEIERSWHDETTLPSRSSVKAALQAANPRETSADGEVPLPTFKAEKTDLKLAFPGSNSGQSGNSFLADRLIFMVLGIVGLAFASAAGFYWYHSQMPENQAKPKKFFKDSVSSRQISVSKIASQIFLKPDESIAELRKIVAENDKDDAGKDAIQAIIEYYRQNQFYADAGNFLMEIKRPAEAVKWYLQDGHYSLQASKALWAAYETSTDSQEKSKYLLQHIQLLLQPLDQVPEAVEKIRLFEKTFPGKQHPYAYYLNPVDQKIESIFTRLSFGFVDSLLRYFGSEFPQVTLSGRPLVEVRKSSTGEYRIVGSYKGEVTFRQDRLKKMLFVFWLIDDNWVLVDTNLTKERQKYAMSLRQKHLKDSSSASRMLEFLENKFRSNFPKIALHEPPPQIKATTKVKPGPKE